MSEPILKVADLSVSYGRHQVLHGVSLDVRPGETVGIIGETGSGKSTLARAVLGLVPASAGSISVDGSDVTRFSTRKWRAFRRRGVVQYVFQDPLRSLDPDLTIADSLIEPLLVRGVPRAEALAGAAALLERVKLSAELLDRLPSAISGGQRQRVAVARALITDPALVILDEPVSALDSANRVLVLEILKSLEAALVFISHDLGSVAGIADRIGVIYQGELVEDRPTRDLITAPSHAYSRLLVSSVPTLRSASSDRTEREELRALLSV
ncbi:ABC transporter ATP-binding protein [Cryptosporangium arvum]|uniref:ABC transporter ATP-binding protein n=1 Tax=Cryptosporangium arvum TaxID=80871 RepID=UPI0004B9F84A|nr:ABC transporter ATP-binding protein [Cryptosporangium arvum]